jgi:hypothetical protein
MADLEVFWFFSKDADGGVTKEQGQRYFFGTILLSSSSFLSSNGQYYFSFRLLPFSRFHSLALLFRSLQLRLQAKPPNTDPSALFTTLSLLSSL